MRRTYQLIEREATICRLARAEADFLLAEHRAHVELTPSDRRGWYRLTPGGYVGTILTPTCRFLLRPKIPVTNLFHLLDPAAVSAAVDDATTPEPGDPLL